MEKYYWLYSSSSQSIAAFIAFLLTGYALVLNLLENVQKNDSTLIEILDSLKIKYFRRLKWVSIITGIAIILNLLCIIFNDKTFHYKVLLMIITLSLTIISIGLGLGFVISIINPDRYKITAKKLLAAFSEEKETIDESIFIKEFIKLETKIREFLRHKDLYVPNGKNISMNFSVRQIISCLYENNIINRYDYEKLLNLNKYRNLVFHGHETKVYKSIMSDIEEMQTILDKKLK